MIKSDQTIISRIEVLERANRRLTILSSLSLLALVSMLVGWQQMPQAPPETIRARKFEVVDAKGVPMITLGTGRSEEGGAITLRDSLGERRGWWSASPEGSSLALTKEKAANAEGSQTAGFSVTKDSAEMNLIGADGSLLTASIKEDKPRFDLWGKNGEVLFSAPWKGTAPQR